MLFHSKRLSVQLNVTVMLVIVLLVTSITALTTGLINARITDVFIKQGLDLSNRLAEKSVFALLLADTDQRAAEQVLQTVISTDVRYIAIFDRDLNIIAEKGETVPDQQRITMLDKPKLESAKSIVAHEDKHDWFFLAAVKTRPEQSPVSHSTGSELLGYVYLISAKAPMHNLIHTIMFSNIILALIIAGLLILWLFYRIKKLTLPLSDLVNTISNEKILNMTSKLKASTQQGPAEIREIAMQFNMLIEQLELATQRERSQFVAMLTHELKTPLQTIQSYAELTLEQCVFLNEDETKNVKVHQQIILQEANDLLIRIKQVLTLQQAESSRLTLTLSTVYFNEWLNTIRTKILPQSKHNDNQLILEHEGHQTVLIDEDKLTQIIINLLTNACKFTLHGTIKCLIKCTDEQLDITVEDTGKGIAPELHERIFSPYFQADMSETRQHQGTGLGLAVTKCFSELLGGNIHLQSEPGSGTCIHITIPLPVPEHAVTNEATEEAINAHKKGYLI